MDKESYIIIFLIFLLALFFVIKSSDISGNLAKDYSGVYALDEFGNVYNAGSTVN
jgi:hypothetical protein